MPILLGNMNISECMHGMTGSCHNDNVDITSVIESAIKRVNDDGDTVPETCDKCGAKVGLYLQGEPVWLCSDKSCGKYFGTAPCRPNR